MLAIVAIVAIVAMFGNVRQRNEVLQTKRNLSKVDDVLFDLEARGRDCATVT